MNIQELATLSDLQLNVKIIIFYNGQLGLVRQQQELFYNKNYIASKFHTSPDFHRLADCFNIKGYEIDSFSSFNTHIRKILRMPGPALLNVLIKEEFNVYPMVPPGEANTVMINR
jgi:acetolactate synthase-1/2/3 large subunit